MKDPGFVPGIIGWVIGFFMAYIIEQINIVGSFPEQLKALKIQRGNYAKVLRENPTPPTDLEEWEKLSRKISEMVKSGSAVFRFSFISRYWMCKKITSLIKDIEMHQSLLLLRIGVAAAGKKQTAVEGEVHVSIPPVAKKEVSKNRMDAAVTDSWNVAVDEHLHSSNVDLLRCAWTQDAPSLGRPPPSMSPTVNKTKHPHNIRTQVRPPAADLPSTHRPTDTTRFLKHTVPF